MNTSRSQAKILDNVDSPHDGWRLATSVIKCSVATSDMRQIMSDVTQIPMIPGEGTKNGTTPQGGSPSGKEKWAPRFWDNEGHVALQFATTDDLDKAIDWLWSTSELRTLPRVHVGV